MIEKLSLIKLEYMYRCISKLNQTAYSSKASHLDPEKFWDRISDFQQAKRMSTDPDTLLYKKLIGEKVIQQPKVKTE